jgi:uncharacterized protein
VAGFTASLVSMPGAPTKSSVDLLPFREFLFKVASRCNLNCSYCYVYNKGDSTWRAQPPFMSLETARQAALRIRTHAMRASVSSLSIIFHGGEPLLGGVSHLQAMTDAIGETFKDSGIEVHQGIQSNGTLVTRQVADFLLEHSISIGISVDGPPKYQDAHRVDHKGRGSSKAVESALAILSEPRYAQVFSGLLCVVDLDHDPIEVVDYLLSWNTRGCDLLLPLENYDRRPPGKEDLSATPYADWLIAAFDHWATTSSGQTIRFFESMIRGLVGGVSLVESIGTAPTQTIVVETDGRIEALDALKTAYHGAARLGYDVFRDSFDVVARDRRVRMRQLGATALAAECRNCRLVESCGGGYLPHRFSSARGFDNPSVYCADLIKVFDHIRRYLEEVVVRGIGNRTSAVR